MTLSGAAEQFLDFGLELRWRLKGHGPLRHWTLSIGWHGDRIAFKHSSRIYHRAVLGLSTSL